MNSNKNILVFDDHPHILATLRFQLKMAGYRVFSTNEPAHGIQMIEDQIVHFAIIGAHLVNDSELRYSRLEAARQIPKQIPFYIYTEYEEIRYWRSKRSWVSLPQEILDNKSNGAALCFSPGDAPGSMAVMETCGSWFLIEVWVTKKEDGSEHRGNSICLIKSQEPLIFSS